MADSFQIYFKAGSCDMNAAIRALTGYRLEVLQPQPGHIIVSRPGSPKFNIRLSYDAWVREEAATIGAGTPYASVMRNCDARFEVSFDNLDMALDEINTMMEVQVALQEACAGYLFLPWNGNLSDLSE